jgi:hypothetical protein
VNRIGDVLVSRRTCTAKAVQEALHDQAIFGARLGTHLLRLGAVTESDLASGLEHAFGVPAVFGDVAVGTEVLGLVQRRLVEKYEAVPYGLEGRRLMVLVANPRDLRLIDEFAFASGRSVRAYVTPQARLWELMRKWYSIDRGLPGLDLSSPDDLPARAVTPVAPARRPSISMDLMTEDDFASLYSN